MSEKFINNIDKAISILIKAIIVLLPLFFLPWTGEYFEFNKQFLLWVLMPLAVLLRLISAAAAGELKIKSNPVNFPIVVFLLLTAVASILSLDRFAAFFGSYGRFADAWFGLFCLVIFYFLLINAAAVSAKKIVGLLKLFLYSSVAAAAFSLMAMAGDWPSVLPWPAFNPAGGSLLALALYLAPVCLIAAYFLADNGLRKFERVFFVVGLIVCLIDLALINFTLAWALLFLGAGLMIFGYWLNGRFDFKKLWHRHSLVLAILIFASALFLLWPGINSAKTALGRELPQEARLAYGQSFIIAKEIFKKYPALGSGPGTFTEDFSLYRPAELNQSALWQVRFNKSGSAFLEMLATAGSLTGLSYLLVIGLAIYLNLALIKKYFKSGSLADEDFNLIFLLLAVFIIAFLSQLFFYSTTVLIFIFWLALSLIIAFWQSRDRALFKEKIINLKNSRLSYRLFFLLVFFAAAGWIALLILQTRFFAAEIAVAGTDNREANLVKAFKLNPYRADYRINLAELYLQQARAEALKPVQRRNNETVKSSIARAIEAGRQAITLAPSSVLAQETLAMIYRDSRALTIGSEPWTIKYFSQALALEPTNPILAGELAKAYLNNHDSANAEKYFLKALELKRDYHEAKFAMAKIYLDSKKDLEALALLNELKDEVKAADVYYELGRYYYNHGEFDRAIENFTLALAVSPKHSNSLYGLAVAYETRGDAKQALEYYRQALALNPENEEIKKKIEMLSR
ncbi:MAG: tetratricopeptide repeat protein [Patescibacteria group bacterium]|nr:tetratricopeptide repeat protein [Patescibacteria group bacterium]